MDDAQAPLQPGQQVGGLRIERELGRGAYGVVYLARDTLIGRPVALKVLPGGGGEVEAEAREQALAEARLVGNLNSPHIVTLYRLRSTEDGGWMLEMEFVDGGALEGEFREGVPFDPAEAVRIFRGILTALETAHAARVIHGDIKLGNVLFGPNRLVKLADFGLGRMLEGTAVAVPLEGRVFGTPAYMAPEVIGGEEAGIASDLWAAAVLLYQLLTGNLPFPATDFVGLWQAITSEEPPPLPETLPRGLHDLLALCLAKAPADRPGSASAVLEALDEIAATDTRFAPKVKTKVRLTNLTPSATSFVGREAEVAALAEMLADPAARLVTVLGPGGIGKTRLSRRLCETLLDRFEGGCWFADLSLTRDLDGIALAVAGALGIPTGGRPPLETVSEALAYRRPLLLVLDNFEQVVAHARATVGGWLERVPGLRCLVTSRALLGLAGERPYELPPLGTPRLSESEILSAEEGLRFAGVRLYAERAREADPAFELTADNAADVARICRELDGMPLAIELAAARSKIMRPGQIAQKLNQKFQLLRSTRADLTPRQKTLTGAIDWSYDLLADWEKSAFLQACGFRGGFFLDAAEEVIDLSGFADAPLTMDVVQGLREKSLLRAYDLAGETRLDMYAAIREYGQQKWEATADAERKGSLGERHTRHYLATAESWNARIPGVRDQQALDRIEAELDNLKGVEERAIAAGDGALAARTVLAMAETMRIRRAPRQLIEVVRRAMAALGDLRGEEAVRLQTYLAAAEMGAGEWDTAVADADQAVAKAREVNLPRRLARALALQGDLRRNRGRLDEALSSFEEGARLSQQAGDDQALAQCVGGRGAILWQRGDLEGAWDCFERAVALGRKVGDMTIVARQTGNLGVICEGRGKIPEAIAFHEQVEEIARRRGDRAWLAFALGNLGTDLVHSGDLEGALRRYEEAEAIARDLGAAALLSQMLSHRGTVHAMLNQLEEALAFHRRAEAIARTLGDRRRIAVCLQQRASIHFGLGHDQDALACYEEALQIGREIGDRQLVATHRCYQGVVLRHQRRTGEAWAALAEGVALFDEMHAGSSALYFRFKAAMAAVAKERGDVETAHRLRDEALALAERLGFHEQHPVRQMAEAVAELRSL